MTITSEPYVTTTTNAPTAVGYDLSDALRACLLSASRDRTLPILCAVQVTKTGDKLILASTDRYRLTEVTIDLDLTGAPEGDWEVLVDSIDVKRLVTALGKRTRVRGLPVAVGFTMGEMDGPVLTVRTFDGVTLRLLGVEGTYPKVSSLWPDTFTAADMIGFNPSFMADLCKMPGRERNVPVVLKLNGPTKPATSSWESDNVRCRHLLMPVRAS